MNYFDLRAGFELHLSSCWVFACVPTALRSHCACAGPTYPIVLTIVHLDGTSILSLYTMSFFTAAMSAKNMPCFVWISTVAMSAKMPYLKYALSHLGSLYATRRGRT